MPIRDNGEIDIVEMLHTLWRFKFFIIAVTAVFGLVSVYLALTATPVFRAHVVVSKVSDGGMGSASSLASQLGGLGRIAGIGVSQSGPGQEAQAILESRQLSEEFVKRFEIIEELTPEGGKQPTLWQAVKRFRDTVLSIHEDTTEGLTTVAIEWTDPDTAARWANDYVALANEILRARALRESQSNIEYLNKQVKQTSVVELERVIYNLIESEIQKSMLANARAEYAFTVVDPAVAPELRSKPKRTLMVLTGGAAGFILSVVLALVISLGKRVREQDRPLPGSAD